MSDLSPRFQLSDDNSPHGHLTLHGEWTQGHAVPEFAALQANLGRLDALCIDGSGIANWDSLLMAFLLQSFNHCREASIEFSIENMPAGVDNLLRVATAVPAHQRPAAPRRSLLAKLHPHHWLGKFAAEGRSSLAFIGEATLALVALILGRANTRWVDFRNFCHQAGPDAFAIISLTSVLVGMILAYLGAVQLQQFGAEIYVADLVVIGMLREMGVLMTAVVMAGRTGAAYAAQLGTMQTNEEIDAITTMGVSPMEFLVLPRMLALIVMMPLLTIYANVLGIVGGGFVAGGMGITPLQYINEGVTAYASSHVMVGLAKSVIFGALIAVAGCRAGINSGRSSAAVGEAATQAVVTAVVYLIVADAAINIICQQLEL